VGLAARELVEGSGVPTSKIWGFAPVAPPGWVCLDVEWQPMAELTVLRSSLSERIGELVGRHLASRPRDRARIALVVAPKDYLRFHWSKIIATDPSDAAEFGLVVRGAMSWDAALLARDGLESSWLPPILPAAFACGRIGVDGMEATGLQSSAWVAVGSSPTRARLAGCGVVDRPAIYAFAPDGETGYWYEHAGSAQAAAGESGIASAPLDRLPPAVFTADTPIILDWREGDDPAPLERWARGTGRPVYQAPFAGRPSPGAAVLAALASGAYARSESFYRRYMKPTLMGDAPCPPPHA
jgi:hypothetical protein